MAGLGTVGITHSRIGPLTTFRTGLLGGVGTAETDALELSPLGIRAS